MLYLQHLAILTSHISKAQELHVILATVLYSAALEVSGCWDYQCLKFPLCWAYTWHRRSTQSQQVAKLRNLVVSWMKENTSFQTRVWAFITFKLMFSTKHWQCYLLFPQANLVTNAQVFAVFIFILRKSPGISGHLTNPFSRRVYYYSFPSPQEQEMVRHTHWHIPST